jgi:alkanesulfonate monooxygenase
MSALSGGDVAVYTINPKSRRPDDYWRDIETNIAMCGRHSATGVLCFSGGDTQIDPWIVARTVAGVANATTGEPLTPLVALNPNTMPPYTAAKMVSSIEQVCGGRVALNLITGLSSREREVLGDDLPHDARYDRLLEHATIVTRLLAERRPVSFEGRFYRIRQATLLPRNRQPRAPECFIAGHSPAARAVADQLGARRLRMLTKGSADDVEAPAERVALHFGLVTRPDGDDAWAAARAKFPDDPDGRAVFEATLAYTDSEWKRQLQERLQQEGDLAGPFWLGPFRHFQSDCPFLVGSHAEVTAILQRFMARGVNTFVLDLLPHAEEFENAAAVFHAARTGRTTD